MKKHLPNFITCLNLLSGCIAMVMAFNGNFLGTVVMVLIAAVFDFLDGLCARLLKAYSAIGKELDSLADMVSFGVAPAVAVFVLLEQYTLYSDFLLPLKTVLPYVAFLIPVFSALRLAKFNIDERQTTSFLGLPTPANALFWVSFVYGVYSFSPFAAGYLYLTVVFVVLLSLLLVLEIPMFSLKFSSLKWQGNQIRYLFLMGAIVLFLLFTLTGIAYIILWYLLLSLGVAGVLYFKQSDSKRF